MLRSLGSAERQAEIASLKAPKGQVESSSGEAATVTEPFDIPPQMIPTLNLLREHIAELTRDNDALRNTFLPRRAAPASAKAVLPDPNKPSEDVTMSESKIQPDDAAAAVPVSSQEVDLEAVVRYVKDLIRENEELGAMVVEAGRTDQAEWRAALDGEH